MNPVTVAPLKSTRSLRARLIDYALLMRLDKPIGIWLLLWPTLWGLWLASRGIPSLPLLASFVFGTVLMRSAGCVINDLADRDFDPHVERTRNRPIAAGRVSPREALLLFVVLCLLALLCAMPLNAQTLLLAIPAVLLAASYPLAKRFHSLPQAHLGIAFSWGIPMAFVAVRGAVPWAQVLTLMAANLCWTIAYDTLYAMTDRADDLKVGVRSSAILFGRRDLLMVGLLQTTSLTLLAGIGFHAGLRWPFFAGVVVAGSIVLRQMWTVRDRDPRHCFQAFLNNTWVGCAIWLGLAAAL